MVKIRPATVMAGHSIWRIAYRCNYRADWHKTIRKESIRPKNLVRCADSGDDYLLLRACRNSAINSMPRVTGAYYSTATQGHAAFATGDCSSRVKDETWPIQMGLCPRHAA